MVLARISSFTNNPRTKSSLVWKSKLSENSGGTAGEQIATWVSWRSYRSSTRGRSTYVSCKVKYMLHFTAQSHSFYNRIFWKPKSMLLPIIEIHCTSQYFHNDAPLSFEIFMIFYLRITNFHLCYGCVFLHEVHKTD